MSIFHSSCYVQSKSELAESLIGIAEGDLDFSGANGEEYLWEHAKKAGFETNMAYAINVAMKESSTKEIAEKFVSVWMDHDTYYDNYDLAVVPIRDNSEYPLILSLAATTT